MDTVVTIIDTTSGEILSASLDDLSDTRLVTYIEDQKAYVKEQSVLLSAAETTLRSRMQDRNATLLITETHDVKLTPQCKYEYDVPRLKTLIEHVSTEVLAKAVYDEPKVNKTELNKLAKLGGKVKEIIDRAVISIPAAPKIEITPKK